VLIVDVLRGFFFFGCISVVRSCTVRLALGLWDNATVATRVAGPASALSVADSADTEAGY